MAWETGHPGSRAPAPGDWAALGRGAPSSAPQFPPMEEGRVDLVTSAGSQGVTPDLCSWRLRGQQTHLCSPAGAQHQAPCQPVFRNDSAERRSCQWQRHWGHAQGGPPGAACLSPCLNALPRPLRIPLGSDRGAWGHYLCPLGHAHMLRTHTVVPLRPVHTPLAEPPLSILPSLSSGSLGTIPGPTTPLHGPAWGHPGGLTRQEHFPLRALLVHEN